MSKTRSLARLQADLNSILGVDRATFNEVNVDDGVEPADRRRAKWRWKMRDDVVTDGGYPDKVLANAPERAGDFFVVPKRPGVDGWTCRAPPETGHEPYRPYHCGSARWIAGTWEYSARELTESASGGDPRL